MSHFAACKSAQLCILILQTPVDYKQTQHFVEKSSRFNIVLAVRSPKGGEKKLDTLFQGSRIHKNEIRQENQNHFQTVSLQNSKKKGCDATWRIWQEEPLDYDGDRDVVPQLHEQLSTILIWLCFLTCHIMPEIVSFAQSLLQLIGKWSKEH